MTTPATTTPVRPAPHFPGIAEEHQPATGTAPGWPLVLYFHHVNPAVQHYTALAPDGFARGLETVLERFRPYSPSDLLAPGGPVRPAEPSVLITFDDGYRDNAVYARPVLDAFGVRAVFFVNTGRISDRSTNPREDFLSWEQCDAFAEAGHTIAAHTRTHPHLDRIGHAEARDEVEGSLQTIEERYGRRPDLFAYPYGGIPAEPLLPPGVLGFGTVRSPALPWSRAPHAIRRTYLPVGATEAWPDLVRHWHENWYGDSGNREPRDDR
ncbi:polysaccharide deacetylase family protein [Streptomyces sp. NPDC059629]|uniref:polysaccharide deacetylase family protein n=1 Tax=Streptomyces sp. NPDC059629 TaxID=3346889 RepID=UPI0036C507FC